MTLAEMRELLTRELALQALANGDSQPFPFARMGLLLRRGRPLVMRHVRARQRLRWCKDIYLVEKVERDALLFHEPRLLVTMALFLDFLVRGRVRDA